VEKCTFAHGQRLMRKQEKIILFLLAGINFTHILDFMIMMPLGSYLIPHFGITAQQFTFLVSSYSFSAAFSGFMAAFFVDRMDRKKVLLFGAESLKDSRKGGDLLLKALQMLPQSLKSETIILTFGSGGETIASQIDTPTINLGYVSSDRLKSLAFSAADLFIFPTRADNLPLVLQESMASGTPMVSFDIGGVSDLVRHNITGYLAKPEDTQDFSNGIVNLLEDDQLRQTMSQNCRKIALEEYNLERQAKRYIELYQEVLI
jgi:glycosyltransferase involved in cell wall biosynthesis